MILTKEVASNSKNPVELGEVVEFLDNRRRPIRASERVNGDIPYYGANGIQGYVDDYIFDEPLILLAEDGGHFDNPARGIAYEISGKSWVNNHAHVLRVNGKIDRRYLFWVLRHYDVTPYITGSTRAKLNKGQAENIIVPLLENIEEQRKVAAVLDKADEINAKRKQATMCAEKLTKSYFLDLLEPYRDRLEPLDDHLEFVTSGSRGWAKYYVEEGSRFIRSLDVRMNHISNDDAVYVNAPKSAEADRAKVREGDVLLTITGSKIGRVAPVKSIDGDAYISQHVAIVRPKPTLTPDYLSFYLSLDTGGQRQIENMQYGQTKPGLNLKQIRSFAVPVPPPKVQQRFTELLEKMEEYKSRKVKMSGYGTQLLASLSKRAFRGELLRK